MNGVTCIPGNYIILDTIFTGNGGKKSLYLNKVVNKNQYVYDSWIILSKAFYSPLCWFKGTIHVQMAFQISYIVRLQSCHEVFILLHFLGQKFFHFLKYDLSLISSSNIQCLYYQIRVVIHVPGNIFGSWKQYLVKKYKNKRLERNFICQSIITIFKFFPWFYFLYHRLA